ncbi:hypothetical protein ACO03_11905 [Pantoea ananatis]|nr:hypothetical protein ACO03_11905 [Pantoea ananatis]
MNKEMENNVAYLYTDNTYMSIGFKNLPYNNYHFHSHSINALADHDADTHSFIFIDLDSLEKARQIKISLLSEKLSSFPYVILIGESKLRFFFGCYYLMQQ